MAGQIQSIERAAALLHILGAVPDPIPLAELARLLELPKSTVHGIVRTLCAVGFAVQQPGSGHYSLGSGLTELGQQIDPHLLRSRAINWADGLAAHTGLEVHLGVLKGPSVQLIGHVFRPDGSPQRLRVGELQPAHATALGQALLAWSPTASRVHELELTSYTQNTPSTRVALVRTLQQVRRQGWACVDGAFRPGSAGLAAPIRHHVGIGVGAMAVSGPRDRLLQASGAPREGLVEQVVAAADATANMLQDRL
ncbi:MAG: IclR family transcriptional regulator [Nocardioides sp.]|nr:IclR family transcriptional regulator [Nocardioides sp.]